MSTLFGPNDAVVLAHGHGHGDHGHGDAAHWGGHGDAQPGRADGHVHVVGPKEDAGPHWVEASEAYTGLRTSLQLLAGLQLVGRGTGDLTDLRRAVLVRVRLLLDEVHERLNMISAPSSALPYLRDLGTCYESLREIAGRQARERAGSGDAYDAERTRQMLEWVTDRLRRCQRYDLGLRFFGSGGCADVEHALSHLRHERSIS